MDLFLSGVDLKRSLRAGKTERRDAFATDASSSRSNMEICSAVREWEANSIRGGLMNWDDQPEARNGGANISTSS